MLFNGLLYASLIIFGLGLIYKITTWMSRKVGVLARGTKPSQRASSALKGVLRTVFSARISTLLLVFFRDVIFQSRILKEDFLRWLMHMLIYGGFMLLLLMHALGNIITISIFSEYYSTLNPFLFLRDLFGLMVIAGIAIAVYRRFILKVPRLRTNGMDYYAIIILAVIMLSGIALEAVKITSYSAYQRMVEEYADTDDEDELKALETFWVARFGVISPNVRPPFEEEALENGLEMHEMSCMGCHAKAQWAFSGYILAKIVKPAASALDRVDAPTFLWYIHILACFIGLAYLPFSKMFHIIASPISLLANAVMDRETSDPVNIATRQAMELDACMHCGTCSLRCSAGSAFEALGNDYILPSEKMVLLKTLAAGKDPGRDGLSAIQEGIYVCTNCDRCTVVCPAGINLKELWVDVREELIQEGATVPYVLSPYSYVRGLNRETLAAYDYPKPIEAAKKDVSGRFDQHMDKEHPLTLKEEKTDASHQLTNMDSFSSCFSCENCTTVCPVVQNFDEPEKALGLLPHQIMCCLGLGLVEMASGPKMLWDCVTCYQCQEHCPQKVDVTDLLYQLKNLAVKNLK
ncbi:4Fe-4S dicluster domain-containing protein [Thermodesulfobacteriota bacterium]